LCLRDAVCVAVSVAVCVAMPIRGTLMPVARFACAMQCVLQ